MSLDCAVTIGGSDVSAYVVSISRLGVLEDPVEDGVSIEMSSAFDAASVNPYAALVVSEQGELTLTGYVDNVEIGREPKKKVVNGKFNNMRARDYFIPQQETFTTGSESMSFWVDRLCGMAGVPYSILASGQITTGSGSPLGENIQLGMQSVADALMKIIAYGNWHMRNNPDGTLEFIEIPYSTTAEHTLTPEEWELSTSDEYARNTIKVWGASNSEENSTGSGGWLYYKATATIPNFDFERAGVVAEPSIGTIAKAQAVAEVLLAQYGYIYHTAFARVLGNAEVQPGDWCQVTGIDVSSTGSDVVGAASRIETTLDTSGYDQKIFFSERPRRLNYMPGPKTRKTGVITVSVPGFVKFEWDRINANYYGDDTFKALDSNNNGIYLCGKGYYSSGSYDYLTLAVDPYLGSVMWYSIIPKIDLDNPYLPLNGYYICAGEKYCYTFRQYNYYTSQQKYIDVRRWDTGELAHQYSYAGASGYYPMAADKFGVLNEFIVYQVPAISITHYNVDTFAVSRTTPLAGAEIPQSISIDSAGWSCDAYAPVGAGGSRIRRQNTGGDMNGALVDSFASPVVSNFRYTFCGADNDVTPQEHERMGNGSYTVDYATSTSARVVDATISSAHFIYVDSGGNCYKLPQADINSPSLVDSLGGFCTVTKDYLYRAYNVDGTGILTCQVVQP